MYLHRSAVQHGQRRAGSTTITSTTRGFASGSGTWSAQEAEDLCRHDKWLCMMYPRLALLRDFLRYDGVIMVSIDDFEACRLRHLLDEVFGPGNFIAQLVWDKTRKNDAKLFSTGHEYLLVYARSLERLKELKTVWREQKRCARLSSLGRNSRTNMATTTLPCRRPCTSGTNPCPEPSLKKLSRYKWIDRFGPWRDRDISGPAVAAPDTPCSTLARACRARSPRPVGVLRPPRRCSARFAWVWLCSATTTPNSPFRKARRSRRRYELEKRANTPT